MTACGSIRKSGADVDQAGEQVGERHLHSDAKQDADQPTNGAKYQRLDQVDLDDLAGARAQ